MQLIESTPKRDCSDKRTFLSSSSSSSSSLTCDYGELVVLLIVVLALRHAREGAVERANLIRKQSQYEGAIPLILSPCLVSYFEQLVYDLSIPTSYVPLYLHPITLVHQHNARSQ
jgi:hypothetical protein